MMNRKVLFWPLAAMLLTACEKGLVDGIADVAPTGQAANSVLQVLPSLASVAAAVAYHHMQALAPCRPVMYAKP